MNKVFSWTALLTRNTFFAVTFLVVFVLTSFKPVFAQVGDFDIEPDRIIFDFYVAGQNYGSLLVEYTDRWVQVIRPSDALDQMPVVKDKEAFRELLTGRIAIPQGVSLPGVGTLTADPGFFSVSLDLDRAQVVESALKKGTLRSPSSNVSLKNRLSLRGERIYDEEKPEDPTSHTISHNTTLSKGRWRAQFSGTQSEELPYDYSNYSLSHDVATRTYSFGMLSSRGTSFVGSTGYLGVGLSSNYGPVSGLERFRGTHIEFFVPSRSQVRVYRNETELLYAEVLEFGMHILDTTTFPEGAYDLRIEIEEENGTVVEERRFFAKSEYLVEYGYPSYSFQLGVDRDAKEIGDTPIFQGNVSWRVLDELELELNLYSDMAFHVFESAVRGNVGLDYRYDGALSFTSEGDAAFRTNVYYQPRDPENKLYWNLNFTHMFAGHENQSVSDEEEGDILRPLLASDRTMLSSRVSYNFGRLSLAYRVGYTQYEDNPYTLSHGPSAAFNIFSKGPHRLTASSYFTKNRDSTEFSGLARYNYMPGRGKISLRSDYRQTARTGMRSHTNTNTVSYDNRDNYGKGLSLSYYNRQEGGNDGSVQGQHISTELKGGAMSGRLDYDKREQDTNPTTERLNYAFDTNVFLSKDPLNEKEGLNVAASYRSGNALIKLEGNAKDTEILVKVNNIVRDRGYPGDQLMLNLSEYDTHSITIEPALDSSIVHYDAEPATVTLYPDNLFTKTYRIDKMTLVIGQLVDVTGAPINFKPIQGLGSFAITDAQGNFQVEMIGNETLFVDTEETTCTAALPNIETDEYFHYIGPIVCG